MRIAIVYDCLFPWTKGGGERVYRRYADEWSAAGHQVTYVTRRQWEHGDAPQDLGFEIAVVSHDRHLYDEHGVRTLSPALRFTRGMFGHLRRHRHSYDAVVVSATPSLNVVAARAALMGSSTRVSVDWLEAWRPAQWREYSGVLVGTVASTLQRVAIRLSPTATCYAQLMAQRLLAQGFKGDLLVAPGLVEDGTDRAPQFEPEDPPFVLYVGRHIADKRVETIPAALAYARRSLPRLTARVLGDGPTRPRVEEEVARLDLAEAVTLPGFVSQQELDDLLGAASCLILPSTREGYGLVVMEAAAAATPSVVVQAEDNSAVELITQDVNGVVAPSGSPDDLGEAILRVVGAGQPLRKRTRAWFEDAARSRTLSRTAAVVLARLEQLDRRS